MPDGRSADGVFSVGVECESLDSIRRLPLSALGVDGVLIDLVPLDLSLVLVKVPEPLSRFCKTIPYLNISTEPLSRFSKTIHLFSNYRLGWG